MGHSLASKTLSFLSFSYYLSPIIIATIGTIFCLFYFQAFKIFLLCIKSHRVNQRQGSERGWSSSFPRLEQLLSERTVAALRLSSAARSFSWASSSVQALTSLFVGLLISLFFLRESKNKTNKERKNKTSC